jgi:hypothetical protein
MIGTTQGALDMVHAVPGISYRLKQGMGIRLHLPYHSSRKLELLLAS